MNTSRLALAFTAGMLTAINPCGFALLPAYLTYFLGIDDPGADTPSRPPVLRALWVSMAVTLGFVTVFGVVGLIWSSISSVVATRLPYVTMGVGVALVVLGVAITRGFEPTVRLPKVGLTRDGRELASMYLYGVTYAVASLSCSIGVFISIVSITIDDADLLSSTATFVAYALGMGALLAVLTVSVALARTGIVTTFRRALPYVQRASGVLVILAGCFVTYYAWIELQELDGRGASGPVRAVRDIQSAASRWIEGVGAAALALGAIVFVGTAVGLAVWFGHRRRANPVTAEVDRRTPEGT